MDVRRLLPVIGAVVAAIGVAMVTPAAVAAIYREWGDAVAILLAAALTMGAGTLAWRLLPRPDDITTREGFAIVGLAWFGMTFFGTLPYLFSGAIGGFTDAFFETAAGFTTTGSSIVADPGTLGHGILWWRSLTQWIGGMGIIVLSVAILPLLGVGGVQLVRAESPGPMPDRLTPRFRETAKRLWIVYLAMTLVEVVLLTIGDMTLFEAFAHSFTTMSTGGFGTDVGSLGAFSLYSQWIVIVFMVLAGASFALHFRALRKPDLYLRHAEFRLYLGILAVAAVLIVIGTWGGAVGTVITDGVFTATSIMTTTGFATADFGQWATALQILVVGLMFIGGMAGSTGGGVKVFRIGVLYQASRSDIRRLIHPRGVFPTRMGTETVSDDIVESVQSFFLLYMFLFMTGTLLLSMVSSQLDLASSVSAAASAIGNIGPGLADVGPAANYAGVSAAGKWLLSLLMIVGRLEIFPIVLLLTRELWRR